MGAGCVAGSTVTVPRGDGGAIDFGAVARCARTLKTNEASLRTDGSVRVNAASETPYQDVMSLMDAVRKDDMGELFPEVSFGLPTAAPERPKRAAPPVCDAASGPFSISASSNAAEEGLVVLISKSQILVGDERVLEYPDSDAVRSRGLPASFKRNGEADYFIVPLAEHLARERDLTMKLRSAKAIDPARANELIVVADSATPYRLFREVLYTAAETGFDKYHLMVLQKAH